MTPRARTPGRAVVLTLLIVGSAGLLGVGPAALADSHATEIGCTTIDEPGTYVLTSDISNHQGTCLDIESPNVTIDGQGHTISNVNGTAILLNDYDRNGLTVRNLVIENSAGGGIRAQWTEDVTIENVAIRDAGGIGIALGDDVSGVTIDGVTVTGSEEGIFMGDVADATITDTELRNNDEWGLRVYEYSQPRLEDTAITGNQHGIHVELAGGFDAEGIEIRDNDVGVAFVEDTPSDTRLHDSVIADNDVGVTSNYVFEDDADLNFTHNYWGAESGPSSAGDEPVADPETGTLADGSGDSIAGVDGTAVAPFDPWLDSEGGEPYVPPTTSLSPETTTTTVATTETSNLTTSDPTTNPPATDPTTETSPPLTTEETTLNPTTSDLTTADPTTETETETTPPSTTVETTETLVTITRETPTPTTVAPTTETGTPTVTPTTTAMDTGTVIETETTVTQVTTAETTAETTTGTETAPTPTTTEEMAAGTPQTDTTTETVGAQPTTEIETDTAETTETGVPGIPGFGIGGALVAIVAAGLLALRSRE